MTTNNRLVAIVALLLVALAVPAAHAAVAQAATFDEKVDNAAAIILGKCVKTEARFDPTGRWIVTYATFNVEETIRAPRRGRSRSLRPAAASTGFIRKRSASRPFAKATSTSSSSATRGSGRLRCTSIRGPTT